MKTWALCFALLLGGCAAGMTPITDPVFIQAFTISNPAKSVLCSGTYSRSVSDTEVIAPITCQDGRTGNVAVRIQPNGHPMVATASLADGSIAHATFLPIMGDRHAYASSANLASPTPSYLTNLERQRVAASRSTDSPRSSARGDYILGPRGGCYYITSGGNRQYVDRSLCSSSYSAIPSGSYRALSSSRSYGRSTYVRSYTRKDGTRVSGHYRRSRR